MSKKCEDCVVWICAICDGIKNKTFLTIPLCYTKLDCEIYNDVNQQFILYYIHTDIRKLEIKTYPCYVSLF